MLKKETNIKTTIKYYIFIKYNNILKIFNNLL
jgi:hypothetical protein